MLSRTQLFFPNNFFICSQLNPWIWNMDIQKLPSHSIKQIRIIKYVLNTPNPNTFQKNISMNLYDTHAALWA